MPLLACWRPERLVSSPWRRCLDTVEPYATVAGLAVRTKGSLSEDGARRSPGRVRRNVQRLLDRGRPALLCTHRPALVEVFGVVTDREGVVVSVTLETPSATFTSEPDGDGRFEVSRVPVALMRLTLGRGEDRTVATPWFEASS